MTDLSPVRWDGDSVVILDQRKLPFELVHIDCRSVSDVAECIRTLAVRGAPAIGVAAGYAVALAAHQARSLSLDELKASVSRAADEIKSTRPTARNLFWAVDLVGSVVSKATDSEEAANQALSAAVRIHEQEMDIDRRMSEQGADLIEPGSGVLTHCNTGELATAGYGSALGVIKAAWERSKSIKVYATETRPLLQGSRLTTLELLNSGIPAKLIVDSAAGYLMKLGHVNQVVVGADRILSDGTTANKIGTYSLAVLAKEHGIPFYIAAPLSTFDLESREIKVEYRSQDEVKRFRECAVAHADVEAWNPAFDVTPPSLITGIVTEAGVLYPPYRSSIRRAFAR